MQNLFHNISNFFHFCASKFDICPTKLLNTAVVEINPKGVVAFIQRAEKIQAHKKREFDRWWNGIGEQRRESYLRLGGSESPRQLMLHIQKCKNVLDIIDKLETETGDKVFPIDLKTEGVIPTVVVQIGDNPENLGTITERVAKNSFKYFEASFDTTKFGAEAERHEFLPGQVSEKWKLKVYIIKDAMDLTEG